MSATCDNLNCGSEPIKRDYEKKVKIGAYSDGALKKMKEIVDLCYAEDDKRVKVAFYYENIKNGISFSFNSDVLFYAASTAKIVACLMLLKKIAKGEVNWDDTIFVKKDDLVGDSGVIRFQSKNTYYTLHDLLLYALTESDNVAYFKLLDYLGKENVREFGLSLGAKHTLESKTNDRHGLTTCEDMLAYWKAILEFIKEEPYYGNILKYWLFDPSYQIVKPSSICYKDYARKYGSWDISYHETGIVFGPSPFYMMIFTQLGKEDYKDEFINKIARLIFELNDIVKDL